MKRFNASKVRCSTHLVPSTEKQKAYHRRVNGIKKPFSADREVIKTSDGPMIAEGYSPLREDYTPPRLRGRSGTRLNPATRALLAARREGRKAFFAELGVRV